MLVLAMALTATAAVCNPPATSSEITRERAIDIARQEAKLEADSVEAERVMSEGQPVWRVTFKGRLPDQPPGLFETRIVEIDARTGKVVRISTS